MLALRGLFAKHLGWATKVHLQIMKSEDQFCSTSSLGEPTTNWELNPNKTSVPLLSPSTISRGSLDGSWGSKGNNRQHSGQNIQN